MKLRKWAGRFVSLASAVIVSLALLAFLTVQIDQRLLRHRAERLSADMHQVRLYQTTWADAQRLMRRWGAWGHYDGSCTAASCEYKIELESVTHYNPRIPRHAWLDWFLKHDHYNLYEWLGGRGSAFYASFTVHDGTIWRESSSIGVSVFRGRILTSDIDDSDWSLSIGAMSYQRLHRTLENQTSFVSDSDDQLAAHPYYKVGRPSGCMINCQIGSVYYSTHAPPAEIERLTSYNFSCFTRFNPCMHIDDLLPAAKEWHLYDNPYESSPSVPIPHPSSSVPEPVPAAPSCGSIPIWAQARDARYVLAVDVLSTETLKSHENNREYHHDVSEVRIVSSLKEPAPWLPGVTISARRRDGLSDALPTSGEEEHLLPGRQYIVFAIGNDRRDQLVTKDSPIEFERCGVRADTPGVLRELENGFAQNDTLNP